MPHALVQLSQVPQWLGIVNIIGDVLWIVAYVLTIRKGFTDRTYGLPMLCIALNFTWEFIYAVIFAFPNTIIQVLRWIWLIADIVIVYQLFRYGRAWQTVPLIRKYFYPLCVAMFVFAYVGQLTFHYSFADQWGMQDAYMINLVMSILFVGMYFGRPGEKGLSIGAAWAKMLGTGILSVGSCFMPVSSFLVFLFVTIFLFDVAYIVLLYQHPSSLAAQTGKEAAILAAK